MQKPPFPYCWHDAAVDAIVVNVEDYRELSHYVDWLESQMEGDEPEVIIHFSDSMEK